MLRIERHDNELLYIELESVDGVQRSKRIDIDRFWVCRYGHIPSPKQADAIQYGQNVDPICVIMRFVYVSYQEL